MRPAEVDGQVVDVSCLLHEAPGEVGNGLSLASRFLSGIVEGDQVGKKRVMTIAARKLWPRESRASQRANLQDRQLRLVERGLADGCVGDEFQNFVIGDILGSHAVLERGQRTSLHAVDDRPQGGRRLVPRGPVELHGHRKIQAGGEILQRLDELRRASPEGIIKDHGHDQSFRARHDKLHRDRLVRQGVLFHEAEGAP